MKRIALIGYGSIGRSVVTAFREAGHDEAIVAILVRPQQIQALLDKGLPAVGSLDELLARQADVVAEVAGQEALAAYGPAVLEAGCDLLVISIGALGDPVLHERLTGAALKSGHRILLCSGAIGGTDAIAAMKVSGLERVTYRSRKPPSAWKATPAERILDLDNLAEPVVFYRGNARDAAVTYPKNANVAATVALVGLGFERTAVELVADPTVSGNLHEIEAEGRSGRISIQLEGRPSPENPKTSMLTALSVVRELMNLDATVAI
ncbi:aspartate dehydrogenase [Telmatospirillum sp. J64-1]|uniref:aspartate dehydrogenase n=1 Tax=Telmatospirillum sp. J64-1 TaxID=2502183 RepID=UPI00115DE3B7|nr:aspartate dehydrogenase [Telmatospirillum sp. J64-1]